MNMTNYYLATREFLELHAEVLRRLGEPQRRANCLARELGGAAAKIGTTGITSIYFADGDTPDPETWRRKVSGGYIQRGYIYRRNDKATKELKKQWKSKEYREADSIGIKSEVFGIGRLQAQFLFLKFHTVGKRTYVRCEDNLFVKKVEFPFLNDLEQVWLSRYALDCEKAEEEYKLV